MERPEDIVREGRAWLTQGEGPHAVLAEARENSESAKNEMQAAWLVVMAEAQLDMCDADEALVSASRALSELQLRNEKACQAIALDVLARAHLVKQNWAQAIGSAQAGMEIYAALDDRRSEARAKVLLARAHLGQMWDPEEAARIAASASKKLVECEDSCAVEALCVAAQAQLLYDPEMALKTAKQAKAIRGKAPSPQTQETLNQLLKGAKGHIATMQNAQQNLSWTARGDDHVPHRWPQYKQQRGERPEDPFAWYAAQRAEVSNQADKEQPKALPQSKETHKFVRKSFKWTVPYKKTDDAWFRQELRYIEPTEWSSQQ